MRLNPIFAIIAGLVTNPVVAASPPDDVTCLYTAMTPEDHEIALVMFAESTQNAQPIEAALADEPPRDDAADAPLAFQNEHMAEVFDLLEEAHMRCLDLYPWNSGQSETSRFYAFLTILGDATARTLTLAKLDIAAADGFYDAGKKKFANRNRLMGVEKTALIAHLQAASWPTDDQALLDMTTDYVETRMMKEMLRRAFDTGDFSKLERL
jgi:hypothetical protein